MRRIARLNLCLCLLALLSLSSSACSGGDDEGPTGPGELTRNLRITYVIENAAGVQTITGSRLLFDGQVIDRYDGAAVRSVGYDIAVERVTPGSHRLAVVVEHAAAAPVQYRTGSAAQNTVRVNASTGPTIAVITLPRDVVALASGQTHEITIQVP